METSLDERARNVILVGEIQRLDGVPNDKREGEDARTNTVEFSGGNTFLVESEITIENETKVEFKFTSAGLKFSNGFMLPVPPVGKGWFDNVYAGDRVSRSRDSRGDTLIVERC